MVKEVEAASMSLHGSEDQLFLQLGPPFLFADLGFDRVEPNDEKSTGSTDERGRAEYPKQQSG
jgi:hypothetical protein